MAGFKKANPKQAALKMAMYGPPGSGKTFTSLLLAEGLARVTGKRIAFIDTEQGTDFYCQHIPAREVHPEAFDFDALYTRSLTEIISSLQTMGDEYGVIVIDSITHEWEAAMAAYAGRKTKAGTIPMQAWGKIKEPYKLIVNFLMSTSAHVIICGRQGNEYEEDEETGQLKNVGFKMKAEGETPYEPHILIRMATIKPKRTNEIAQIVAYVEKDRTGILNGHSFVFPTFETLCAPLMPYLGSDVQANIKGLAENAVIDAEALAEIAERKERDSADLTRKYMAKIELCDTSKELDDIGKSLTPKVKSQMIPADVSELREKFLERQSQLKSRANTEPDAGPPEQVTLSVPHGIPVDDRLVTPPKQSVKDQAKQSLLARCSLAASELWGDDAMNQLTRYARSLSKPIVAVTGATVEELHSLLQSLNLELDKRNGG